MLNIVVKWLSHVVGIYHSNSLVFGDGEVINWKGFRVVQLIHCPVLLFVKKRKFKLKSVFNTRLKYFGKVMKYFVARTNYIETFGNYKHGSEGDVTLVTL